MARVIEPRLAANLKILVLENPRRDPLETDADELQRRKDPPRQRPQDVLLFRIFPRCLNHHKRTPKDAPDAYPKKLKYRWEGKKAIWMLRRSLISTA
jgi:hypothetical protein